MTQEIFLRAISLRDDVSVPERLAHYRPTRRSLPVVRAVIEGGATMVIAAYGSGKSLAAGIGALVVLNDPPTYKTLNPVIRRLRSIDPSLHTPPIPRSLLPHLVGNAKSMPRWSPCAARRTSTGVWTGWRPKSASSSRPCRQRIWMPQ